VAPQRFNCGKVNRPLVVSEFEVISLRTLCSLRLCGEFFWRLLTTETERTQRLHRERDGHTISTGLKPRC
jgi:hypothetical protein